MVYKKIFASELLKSTVKREKSYYYQHVKIINIYLQNNCYFDAFYRPLLSSPQMACFDTSKGSLEEDSYTGADRGDLSLCALAMSEKERESLLSPSDSPGGFSSSTSAGFQAAASQQGYDVEFDPPLESKYECPICLMALRNAIQTPCGHRFCKNCIEKSIRYALCNSLVNTDFSLQCFFLHQHYGSKQSVKWLVVI